ncbi:hypothetical protein A2733_00250 [Candidatus Nomurabacteria bacterium RIFCSPHIGHO2_01_FULL_40_20]|uniref:Ribosomal RNA small subunit methyltransferase E n=1 Tax=Candidatus Nomurabacteria bacterium RIFCSPHIGHO2_01_FULL_40_20 TaxID=1801738 RepID=A0A1F6V347_9BACT|nr:MAG: hypothetical protein A2733_00250 [Candidatus Nomurabacteria bacterium RIFCSPHIGHO2_01_FULL_40_20]
MRLHRFIGDYNLTKNEVGIKNPENIKQIKGVLRLGLGDHLILCDGKGAQGEFSITKIEKEEIICRLEKILPASDPKKKVSLYLAIFKKENFELAVQKAVECGVTNIIPIITERTVKTGLNFSRLEKIILEASEQSERCTLPTLQKTLGFENALAYGYASEEKIIFDPSSSPYSPKKDTKGASIFVGPEGGFTESEIALARGAGYNVSSLGPLILRGETASIIATYRSVWSI